MSVENKGINGEGSSSILDRSIGVLQPTGLGPEYSYGSHPRFILARDFVWPPVPTSWFLPHAGPHLATAHFRSQELGHRTH